MSTATAKTSPSHRSSDTEADAAWEQTPDALKLQILLTLDPPPCGYWTTDAIAAVLGIGESAVRKILARAVRKLRAAAKAHPISQN